LNPSTPCPEASSAARRHEIQTEEEIPAMTLSTESGDAHDVEIVDYH
jgi:hypothetical protein